MRDLGQGVGVARQVRAVDDPRVPRHSDGVGHGRHRRPRVAGDQLQVDTSSSRMKSIVSAASGRSVSSSTISANGFSCGGGSAAGSSGRAPLDSAKATTRRPASVSCRSFDCSPGERLESPRLLEDVGCSEDVARPAEPQAAPLPDRRERDLAADPPLLDGVAGGDRLQRPVALAGARGEPPQRPLGSFCLDPVGDLDPQQAQIRRCPASTPSSSTLTKSI